MIRTDDVCVSTRMSALGEAVTSCTWTLISSAEALFSSLMLAIFSTACTTMVDLSFIFSAASRFSSFSPAFFDRNDQCVMTLLLAFEITGSETKVCPWMACLK